MDMDSYYSPSAHWQLQQATNIVSMYMKESNQAYTQEVHVIFIYTTLQINTLKFISCWAR